jgi:cell division protein FtsB
LLGHSKPDWGKLSVVLGIILAAGGGLWHYADTAASVKNLGDDVKDLKRKSDDLLRTTIETSTRVSTLERRDFQQLPAVSPSAAVSLPPAASKNPP